MGKMMLFLRRFFSVILLVVLSVNCFSEKLVCAEEVAESNDMETGVYIGEDDVWQDDYWGPYEVKKFVGTYVWILKPGDEVICSE